MIRLHFNVVVVLRSNIPDQKETTYCAQDVTRRRDINPKASRSRVD